MLKLKIRNILFISMLSYVSLNGATISNEEKKLWTEAGFKSYDIERWKEIKEMTLDKAKDWKKLGLTSYKAKEINDIELTSTDELKKLFEIGVTINDIYVWKKYVNNLDEIKKWFAMGINSDEFLKWEKVKVDSADEVKDWKSINVTYDNIWEWQRLGISSAVEAKEWLNAGYNKSQIGEFRGKGIYSITELNQRNNEQNKWINAGIAENYIAIWKRIGITEPEIAGRWNNTGINIDFIKSWLDNGFIVPEEVKEWSLTDFSPEEVKDLINMGINPSQALEWNKSGIRTLDYLNYARQNNLNHDEIKQWATIGVDLKKINGWKELNINILEAKQWIDKGFYYSNPVKAFKDLGINSLEEVMKWRKFVENDAEIPYLISIGFKTLEQLKPYEGLKVDHIAKLKEWGITPNKLIISMSYANLVFKVPLFFTNKNTFTNAYAVLEKNCEQIEKDKFFSYIPGSLNKNNCYIFVAKMTERLDNKPFIGKDTKNAIANGISKKNIYVEDFNFNWELEKNKIGVIKGEGSFTYDSNDIPKGKIIYVKE